MDSENQITIRECDCREMMADLEDNSADLVFADYPFDADEELYQDTAEAFERVLKPDGNLVIVNNPTNLYKFAHHYNQRFTFRNGVPLPRLTGLYPPKHMGMKHNYMWFLVNENKDHWFGGMDIHHGEYPDVWDDIQYVNGQRDGDYNHPGAFPMRHTERTLDLTTEPGDTVVEPFTGSGTTPVVCKRFDREYIGSEIETENVEYARQRVADAEPELEQYIDTPVESQTILSEH